MTEPGSARGRAVFAEADAAGGGVIAPAALDATVREGLVLHQAGRLDDAAALYRRVLVADPGHAEANHLFGLVLHQSGRNEEAAAHIGRAIRRMPFNAAYHGNLGVVFKAQNRLAEAVQSYDRSLQIDPRQAQVQCNRGVALLGLGRAEEAAEAQRQALRLVPDYAGAHHHLANALATLGRLDEALPHAERAVALQPGNADLHYALARVQMALEQLQDAAVSLARAVQIRPDSVACADLGKVLMGLGRPAEAVDSYRAALVTDPDNASLEFALGQALVAANDHGAAAESFARVAAAQPDHSGAYVALGGALLVAGQMEAGVAALQRSLELDADNLFAHSSLLFIANYDTDSGPAGLAEQARAFGQIAERGIVARTAHANVRDPAKRLKVGLISGDLNSSPVARFLESVLPALDAGAVELFAYSMSVVEDDTTRRLRRSIPHWRASRYEDNSALDQAIIGDGIDILIDLSGHTGTLRLPLFAGRPAPVSVTWLGYSGTTGLTSIDYILADRFVAPPGDEEQFTEAVWRLPDSYLCFSPPEQAPAVAPLPALANGHVTFGSFNNINKLSPATLRLWAKVLAAVPTSRLLLKNRPLSDPAVADRILVQLDAAGADPARIELMGYVDDPGGHLGTYGRIDVGLDPFPYNGTTTTCEALWMGVPVISLAGDRFIARVGESVLHSAGLGDWVAADEDAYVARAVAAAAGVSDLAALRSGLRPKLAVSPLCDAPRFARNFEAALREMWTRWCAGEGPKPRPQ